MHWEDAVVCLEKYEHLMKQKDKFYTPAIDYTKLDCAAFVPAIAATTTTDVEVIYIFIVVLCIKT